MYLDDTIPSRDKLFTDFLSTINWMKYRQDTINEIVNRKESRKNSTRLRDVPMICRIEEDL